VLPTLSKFTIALFYCSSHSGDLLARLDAAFPAREKYNAVVLGTGAVGENLDKELLRSNKCQKVVSLGRTELNMKNFDAEEFHSKLDKLTQVKLDPELPLNETAAVDAVQGSEVAFCSPGTQEPWSLTLFHMDNGAPLENPNVDTKAFAKICKAGGVKHFSVLSALEGLPRTEIPPNWEALWLEKAVIRNKFDRVSVFSAVVLDALPTGSGIVNWLYRSFYQFNYLSRKPIQAKHIARAFVLNVETPGLLSVEMLNYFVMLRERFLLHFLLPRA